MRLQFIRAGWGRSRVGFTLIEVLVATAVTLILMGLCVQFFGFVSRGVSDSRAMMEMSDRLRNAKTVLQHDLRGVTAPTIPPLRPGAGQGYFEYIEGPIGPIIPEGLRFARNDTQVGDLDDILMFTSRAVDEPFIGRAGRGGFGRTSRMVNAKRSKLAEIAWFMRGTTLLRRVLLIRPRTHLRSGPRLDYFEYDLSMRQKGGTLARLKSAPDAGQPAIAGGVAPPHVVANTLGDLTRREHRYAHQPLVFPYESRLWGGIFTSVGTYRPGLGLPMLSESSMTRTVSGQNVSWPYPLYEIDYGTFRKNTVVSAPWSNDPHDQFIIPDLTKKNKDGTYTTAEDSLNEEGTLSLTARTFDPWYTPYAISQVNSSDGRLANYRSGTYRFGDDVVLTNVLSFDVKVWDPGAPIFQVVSNVETPDGEPQQTGVVLPGEIGYLPSRLRGALGWFMRDPQNDFSQLVGFGAYVDLFYMANNLGDPHDPSSSGGANRKYENRLRRWESLNLGKNRVGSMPRPDFAGRGDERSLLQGPAYGNLKPLLSCVYDTWSTHYERDGLDNNGNGLCDEGTNRVDDNGNGRIDEAAEQETAPPYTAPLRGLQIRIRAFEPDSRAIRQVTVKHDFLPE